MIVIKRNGNVTNFDKDKITSAIRKAMVECNEDVINAEKITNEVVKRLDSEYINIEDIQDEVENCLMKMGFNDVAKSYILYRNERTRKRTEHPLDESIIGLIDMTNKEVLTENSNKQSQLASTQRDLIAGEVSKYISKDRYIPKDIIDAHDKGLIHIHDLDYWLQPITNCELVPLDDIFENGTVINKKLIRKPKSLRTAVTLATQIAAQISSFTYGGQTMSISHLAPYVRISREKIRKQLTNESKVNNIYYTEKQLENIIDSRLKDEIKDSVQTFNYQLSTLNSTNGQSPFLSLAMYISENPEYEKETAMLIEEFLKQRIDGMENEFGVKSTQTFPKLLFFLDDNNMYPTSEYYYLKELAVKSTSLRMNPDYISVKTMKDIHGYAFPCMGCRAFLSPWFDENGDAEFYGRGNVGACTINLPYVALLSKGNEEEFWKILDDKLDLCKRVGILRFDKLKGVKAEVAPLLWQHGVFSRLNSNDEILPLIKKKFTVSLGYSGLYETVKYIKGVSHTTEEGYEFAYRLMKHLQDTTKKWKSETGLLFALYGTPQESTGGVFNDKLKKEFGEIKDITSKGFITNSYHVDVREEIDAFSKLALEGKLQEQSLGGCVSYVETYNLSKNIKSLEQLIDFMYEHNIYAEINFESDTCGECGFSGVMEYDLDKDIWICPQCGNNDQHKLSVVRRTCGYLGENTWTKGRVLDILNRVKHL
ncbi:anaerobic ribonucleoside-triphosphate reductase [Terrisporobacter sp.]|uniref:anaerobic ribonucleoside-triphosphate reductase n=1 Tax=Terrisporobacter sp. TaxID=1965305 RepID=UPI0028A1E575|nr:anaerobic ribonucleoside-triphosphate reductase [Terrisporobacter sp.]